jgi:hypothetical protein
MTAASMTAQTTFTGRYLVTSNGLTTTWACSSMRWALPRREHGYCVDDVARGLVVTCREPEPGPSVRRLARGYLVFVLAALEPAGTCHNRMDVDGNGATRPPWVTGGGGHFGALVSRPRQRRRRACGLAPAGVTFRQADRGEADSLPAARRGACRGRR